ncbi:MAG: c-type cytochrome [Alphaproteobacteria bacterium]|nr:c-type cytochrome [Alphaproteobacteria bacterium]
MSEQHKLLVTRGTEVFQRCTACHRIGPDAENRIGPHLNNLIGRTAGSIAGARYSDAMKKAGQDGLKWDANTLDAFVADPTSFIEDTTMGLDGVEDAEDRKALIAYLSAFATGSSNIPETPAARGLPSADPGIPAEILAIKGDPEYGEYLSSECLTCHQSSGSNRGIPGIVGWPVEDFVVVMHAYKSRKRDNPVMQMMASQLGNDEIAALAAYFQQKGQ